MPVLQQQKPAMAARRSASVGPARAAVARSRSLPASDCRARIVPTILLHFLHPEARWGRYDSMDGGDRAKQEPEPRATQGAVADDRMARIVPTILLRFLHPWRSDAGGRATQGAVAESRCRADGRKRRKNRAEVRDFSRLKRAIWACTASKRRLTMV